MKEKSSHNFLFKPTRQWKKEAEKEEKLSIGTRWERHKEKRRRETTSTSKHTAWVYLSSFSVEAYAKGVEIITSPHSCVCERERERKLRGIKKEYKTGRKKIVGMLKAYSKNIHTKCWWGYFFFHSEAGGIGRLSDSFSKENIYVHKFLYKYNHKMSPTFPHSHK